MANQSGTREMHERTRLRLVDPDDPGVWEPDPAADLEDVATLDELADLFIGEGGVYRDTDAADETPEPAATLEAVITGNLPVRGALWVRAYAAAVSADLSEPVALVRVTPGRTSVALVGTFAETEPVSDIATAVRAAGVAAGHWLLHFDELDQAGLLRSGRIDRVTVLTGADEPAIVSAYRLIKSITEQRTDETGRVGVAIVGADAASGERATARLVDATRQFLGVTLDVRPGVPRVRSASVATLGESDRRVEPAEILSLINGSETPEVVGAGDEPAESPASPASPDPSMENARSTHATTGAVPAGFTEHQRNSGAAGGYADVMHDSRGHPPASAIVGGLAATGLPCPIAPSVELTTDGGGRLHLLCWWEPRSPGDLLRASAWARVNMPLLVRVCPALVDAQSEPVLHVVCTDADAAADLRGTGTIVHLAQRAESVAVEGWVCGRVAGG